MSMELGGSAGTISASIAASQSLNNSIEATSPVAPVQKNFQERTQGSVFGEQRQFGDLTFRNPNRQQRANNSNSGQIGGLLAGNFGSITASRTNNANAPAERSREQDMTKTSDEMMEIANNLTMKDMWAAA